MGQQILALHPLALPIWLAGLWWFLTSRDGKPYRALGWAYLIALGTLLVTGGRFYYLLPAYPMLLAGGAVILEAMFARRGWGWVRPAYVAVLAIGGLVTMPIVVPVLPPEAFIRYTQALRISQPQLEHRTSSALPQFFADRFGWPEMVATVAKVYHALPAEERAQTAIMCRNYGEAGAVDLYGPPLGLPKAISGHNNLLVLGSAPVHGREHHRPR